MEETFFLKLVFVIVYFWLSENKAHPKPTKRQVEMTPSKFDLWIITFVGLAFITLMLLELPFFLNGNKLFVGLFGWMCGCGMFSIIVGKILFDRLSRNRRAINQNASER